MTGLAKTPGGVEREAAYLAALRLVAKVDEDLRRGVRHYRTRAGRLLVTLDEVVRAILDNDLLLPEEKSTGAAMILVSCGAYEEVRYV